MSTLAQLLRAKAQRRKPSWPFERNKNSPQSKGLQLWYPVTEFDFLESGAAALGELYDAGPSGFHLQNVNLITQAATFRNDAVHGKLPILGADGGGAEGWVRSVGADMVNYPGGNITDLAEISFMGWWYRTSESSGQDRMWECALASDSGDDIVWMISEITTELPRFRLRVNGTTGTYIPSAIGAHQIPLNQWFHLALTWTSGIEALGYINGRVVAWNTSPGATSGTIDPGAGSGSESIRVGFSGGGGTTSRLQGSVSDLRQYNRALSAGEIWQVYKNGWDLYLPSRSFYTPAAVVAGGVSVSVPAGAITLAGQAPNVGTGNIVTAPAATAISLAGQTPSVGVGTIVTAPSPTAITLAGQTPVVGTGIDLDVPTGAITLAGQAPNVGTGVIVASPAGTITLAGQVPAVGTGVVVTGPTPATITLAGNAPTIAITGGVSVTVPLGAISLAGIVPTINAGSGEGTRRQRQIKSLIRRAKVA